MLVLLVLAIRVEAAPVSDPIAEAVRYADILTGAELDAQIARRAPDDPEDQLADAASEHDDDDEGNDGGEGNDDGGEGNDDGGEGNDDGETVKRDTARAEHDGSRGAPDRADDKRNRPAHGDAPHDKPERADSARGKRERGAAPHGKTDRADDARTKPARGDTGRSKPARAGEPRGKRAREHDPRSRRHRANAAREGDAASASTEPRERIATADRAPASGDDEPALDIAVAEHAGELALLDDAAVGSGEDTSDDAGLASASAGATETYEARMRSQRSWLVGRLDVGLSWRRRETAPTHAPARLDHQLWLFATWRR